LENSINNQEKVQHVEWSEIDKSPLEATSLSVR